MLCNIFFLPPIIALGIITSITDIKYRKIYNSTTTLFVYYAALVYLVHVFFNFLVLNHKLSNFFLITSSPICFNLDKWVINLGLSALVTYIFWKKRIWGAGDAKLFICYSALIPMCKYTKVYFDYNFASFYLLLTIFIPSSIYLGFDLLRKEIKTVSTSSPDFRASINKILGDAKQRIIPRRFLRLITTFFIYFIFIKLIKTQVSYLFLQWPGAKVHITDMHMVLLLFIFRKLFGFFIRNRPILMYICIIFSVYILVGRRVDAGIFFISIMNSFKNAVFISLLWPFLNKIIDIYRADYFEKTIPFAFWMFLGALIVWFS